ncbi:hypothetical protein B0H19DRAFT_1083771 [Mycena capillaripes]|nr:hypothetical protein B0H19DRAFT_1083771 [Mycena capillaripes]
MDGAPRRILSELERVIADALAVRITASDGHWPEGGPSTGEMLLEKVENRLYTAARSSAEVAEAWGHERSLRNISAHKNIRAFSKKIVAAKWRRELTGIWGLPYFRKTSSFSAALQILRRHDSHLNTFPYPSTPELQPTYSRKLVHRRGRKDGGPLPAAVLSGTNPRAGGLAMDGPVGTEDLASDSGATIK